MEAYTENIKSVSLRPGYFDIQSVNPKSFTQVNFPYPVPSPDYRFDCTQFPLINSLFFFFFFTIGQHAIIPCCCEDWTCPLWNRKGKEVSLLAVILKIKD